MLGFPDSGTWTSTTFDDWGGTFIVDGKDLRFYGTYLGGGRATNFHIKINDGILGAKGGFDEWVVGDPPSPTEDGEFTLKPVKTVCRHFRDAETKTPSGR